MHGRKKQSLGGIVETFSAGAVGRQSSTHVDVEVQEVANGG
jgi:hypothetical protein